MLKSGGKVKLQLLMSRRRLIGVISPALPVQGRNKITKHVEREVICHSNFCHPHVIQFKETFLTPTHLAIAMEYAPGGDMFQFVKRSSGLKVLILHFYSCTCDCASQWKGNALLVYRYWKPLKAIELETYCSLCVTLLQEA